MIQNLIRRAGWAGLLAAGCSLTPHRPADTLTNGQELPVIRELARTHSTFTGPVRLVVHGPATLAQLPLNLGKVDFDRHMVLVAALGPTPTDQYGITIDRVWRDGPVIRAHIQMRYPPVDAPLGTLPASPFHAVVVPRSDLTVRGFDAVFRPGSLSRRRGQSP